MDYMNVRILVQDGMQVRAATIIEGDDPTTLSKVFSKSFLEQDTLLNSDAYQLYDVSDYEYDLDVGLALILPWQDQATLKVTEQVTDIDAELYVTAESGVSDTPPAWVNAVYDLTVVRYQENWRIVSMEVSEVLPHADRIDVAHHCPVAVTISHCRAIHRSGCRHHRRIMTFAKMRNNILLATDGRRDRRGIPQPGHRIRRGLDVHRDGQRQGAKIRLEKDSRTAVTGSKRGYFRCSAIYKRY